MLFLTDEITSWQAIFVLVVVVAVDVMTNDEGMMMTSYK
jgi:hypothetical protein